MEETQAEDERERENEPGSGILHIFGRQLKLCRERAGLDRSEFGGRVGYSASTIASFEQGRRIPPPKFIDQADDLLNAGGVLKAGKEGVARAQYPAFFRDAARLEADAVVLHVYANQVVPGLFGPFTLIETRDGRRIAYVEAYKDSRLYAERESVRELEEQYGLLRAAALSPRESLALIEKLLGET